LVIGLTVAIECSSLEHADHRAGLVSAASGDRSSPDGRSGVSERQRVNE
jgi:hypothetical protein